MPFSTLAIEEILLSQELKTLIAIYGPTAEHMKCTRDTESIRH
jgi:hypothetical protein